METLEAYDLTESYRASAELAGCSHHTVAARDAGPPVGAVAPRVRVIDRFLEKVEELVDRSQGKVRSDKVHEVLASLGFDGSERSTRRAVADAKSAWGAGRRRVHRPWVNEPGLWLWLQYDFGDGAQQLLRSEPDHRQDLVIHSRFVPRTAFPPSGGSRQQGHRSERGECRGSSGGVCR